MNDVVRLHVPPFEPASPTSLAALHRPLVQADTVRCASHCKLCPACEAAQQADIDAAAQTATDLGLRLSQLVEDALSTHLARIEAEQMTLIQTVLRAVLPHLSDTNLRAALSEELQAVSDPLRDVALTLRKHPDLDLGVLPADSRLKIDDDPSHPRHSLSLSQGDGLTTIDPQLLIDACLARLAQTSPSATSEL